MITSLNVRNLLSFGPEAEPVSLRALNVVIGPNGSGKSNLLAVIDLLSHAPDKFAQPIRQGGGIQDWLWKGKDKFPTAEISVDMRFPPFDAHDPIDVYEAFHYYVSFQEENATLSIMQETIEGRSVEYCGTTEDSWMEEHPFAPVDRAHDSKRTPGSKIRISSDQSILSAGAWWAENASVGLVAEAFSQIRLYKEWSFGSSNLARQHQRADMPSDYLESDASNLGLVLNTLRQNPEAKKRLINALNALYEGIEDFDIRVSSGNVQVFLQEDSRIIPATRLSDGTLRYLCLLAILCHPSPPRLVCIEEPELGLHPDVLPTLAKLLQEASQRCQLIVTTHSEVLVDALTDTPEDILVCEKDPDQGTTLRRLNAEELKPWLEKYQSLSELWRRGDLGGTRW
jgi:predicted ATPase